MDARRLDRRIKIQRKETAADEFNEPVVARWCDVATVWASKEDIRDSERFSAGELGAELTTRFQIRYSQRTACIDPQDRIVFDGHVFAIVGIKEIGRREGIEITASARAEHVDG